MPAQIVAELIRQNGTSARTIVKVLNGRSMNGTSARTIVKVLNGRSLLQKEVVDILIEVFLQTGRGIAGTQLLDDGTILLLSRRLGIHQPVLGVNAAGQAIFGNATIAMGNQPPFIIATDIQLPNP